MLVFVFLIKIFAPTVEINNIITFNEDDIYQTLSIYSEIAVDYFLKNKLEIESAYMLLDHELLQNNVFDPENKYSLPYIPYNLIYWQVYINPDCKAIILTFDRRIFQVERKKLGTSFILVFNLRNRTEQYCFTAKNTNGVINILDQKMVLMNSPLSK